MEASEGFPPIAGKDARVLILGSLPGKTSLREHQYYAHPQNAFWPIMQEMLRIEGTYAERVEGLVRNRFAVWDVLRASVRPGSLDADIQSETAVANDFAAFFESKPHIELVVFNGKKAEQLYRRMVADETSGSRRLIGLPSTSPAYAAMPFAGKLAAWREGMQQPPPVIQPQEETK